MALPGPNEGKNNVNRQMGYNNLVPIQVAILAAFFIGTISYPQPRTVTCMYAVTQFKTRNKLGDSGTSEGKIGAFSFILIMK
ncbi:hypothetical protein [Paenibacillus illinoisensis]|uniref:hypothetical protein n=1 Tax=Paenibacillus illinoisensis TaxID=59845 RepID=UPI00203DC4A1|nr:hypothetical protein [Paenibacillus illinoisensis]MCM3203333.1 hypothetical protein [Paenibacillus illinoisensis]